MFGLLGEEDGQNCILELLNTIWRDRMQSIIDGHMGVEKPVLYRMCSTMAGGSFFRDLKDALAPLGMKVRIPN
jgi:hypothetical protein